MTNQSTEATGLDFLHNVSTSDMPPNVGTLLGINGVEAKHGRVVLELKTRPDFANLHGPLHGGITAALMDAAMGSAVQSAIEYGVTYSTLELKVNYIRSVPVTGVVLTATADTIHVGRRTAITECRVHDDEGRLVAHGTSTYIILG
jgi:uncharacterized protein (TIGR00369 family)